MRLQIGFDDDTLRRYDERGSPLLFFIAYEYNGNYFPERKWMDFGCVILGWWITAILKLSGGSCEEELCFMDGPYTLMALRDNSTIQLRSSEGPVFEATISLLQFRSEVATAVKTVLCHAAALDLHGDDVLALQSSLDKLLQES